ncbi:MAG: dihydrolipoyl dehydrogenase [Flavobacteriales bacterium]|nr:dihydrolipoyl dehydrogenase [Flavobacteriales bacterium]
MSTYDVTVIGSGPGGYVAAIRCAQLGMKTAIIEKYNSLGGTCSNVGCIPSKALLDSSEHYHDAAEKFATHGIELKDLKVNMPQMIERKREVVKSNADGIAFLMKKNNIDVHTGVGSFVDKGTLKVTDGNGKETEIKTGKVIIATGSKPSSLPGIEIDKDRIISSTEALELLEVPKKMVVIGAGVIGLELGSVYQRLGCEVTFVEYADSAIPMMDSAMSKDLTRAMKKMGVKFNFSHNLKSAENTGDRVKVVAENKKGEEVTFEGDYCLMAVGRKPYTAGLNSEAIGLEMDDRGRIVIDDQFKTNVDGVYAIGDVVRGIMLAHKAEEEGVAVAELLAGEKPHINYNLIPNVVYTWPEVASVGKTEEELKEAGVKYNTGTFMFKASGRARASMDTDGSVKLLADANTDEILGMHICGPRAADMIAEGVVAMEYRASAEDIARVSHAHPTYTEAIREAALEATGNRALHK